MRNLRLTIEFDGSGFAGWQFQPNRPTVQGAVEAAIERVTGERVRVCGCSRTDAGVSARRFVANFHTRTTLPGERLRLALNYHLPPAVTIQELAEVPAGFHARFDAVAKQYRYTVIKGVAPLWRDRAWEVRLPINVPRCRAGLVLFVGERDFRPFCHTADTSGVCRVRRLALAARGRVIVFTIEADRFLFKMVRRIVGALVAVGTGRLSTDDIADALAGRRHRPFQTAPAAGLVLERVYYRRGSSCRAGKCRPGSALPSAESH